MSNAYYFHYNYAATLTVIAESEDDAWQKAEEAADDKTGLSFDSPDIQLTDVIRDTEHCGREL